jgi:hypothetical protein
VSDHPTGVDGFETPGYTYGHGVLLRAIVLLKLLRTQLVVFEAAPTLDVVMSSNPVKLSNVLTCRDPLKTTVLHNSESVASSSSTSIHSQQSAYSVHVA